MEAWLTPWSWATAAVILAVLEIFAPGVFLIFVGAAAAVVAVLAGLGLPALWQPAAFAPLAVAAVLIGRIWYRQHPPRSPDPHLNRRSERMVGSIVTVTEPVGPEGGRVRVGDGEWAARGPSLDAGAVARVIAVEGGTLVIECV